jgi:hypothetical protein
MGTTGATGIITGCKLQDAQHDCLNATANKMSAARICVPEGGGGGACQPATLPHPQSEILKNTDFVDTMKLKFYVIYGSV